MKWMEILLWPIPMNPPKPITLVFMFDDRWKVELENPVKMDLKIIIIIIPRLISKIIVDFFSNLLSGQLSNWMGKVPLNWIFYR